jgi:hypothetical protein
MALPGVKVGPLDPEATQAFGQVAQGNSARTLIRLHAQMHPPVLRAALTRPLDEARTAGLDFDEVQGYVGGLAHDNGDPLVPADSEVVGAAVRGDRQTGQVLTFQYRLPSGRIGKWFAPYGQEHLPTSFEVGAENARIKKMQDRGLVAFDDEGTHTEILRRQLAEAKRETAALREFVHGGGQGDAPEPGATDTRDQANIAAENERLGRENVEMRERLAKLEALVGAAGGGVPTGGLEEEQRQGEPPQDTVRSADPPVDGYEGLRGDQAIALLKDEGTSDDQRRAILEYERTHANRRSVVGAGEQLLDTSKG